MNESIIKPRRPNGAGWAQARDFRPHPQLAEFGYPIDAWEHAGNGLFVLSAVEVATEPGKPSLGPEYHLSVSKHGNRCSSGEAVWVLAQFDLLDATEDNHVPSGRVRNFWRPVADNLSGYICPCNDDEPAIREDKGDYVWRGLTK